MSEEAMYSIREAVRRSAEAAIELTHKIGEEIDKEINTYLKLLKQIYHIVSAGAEKLGESTVGFNHPDDYKTITKGDLAHLHGRFIRLRELTRKYNNSSS